MAVLANVDQFVPDEATRRREKRLTDKRHLYWVKRTVNVPGSKKFAWRPQKLNRRHARAVLVQLDNVLRVSTSWCGLGNIIPKDDGAWRRETWKQWPLLFCCLDQGSDNVSAMSALMYSPKLYGNCIPFWEWSHGANNDFHGLLKELKLFDLCLITLVIMNMAHGPDKDEGVRHEQFCDMYRIMVDEFRPCTSALFRSRSKAMAEEMQGEFDVEAEIGVEESLWKHLQATKNQQLIGERVKMCHYFGWWEGAQRLLKRWSLCAFKAEAVALEMDWLGTTKFLALPIVKDHVKEANEMLKTTSTRLTPIEAKLVRTSCQNNVVTQVALLQSDYYKRQIQHMVHFVAPVKKWQGNAVSKCDSAKGCRDWLVEEMSTKFGHLYKELIHLLANTAVLQETGYFAGMDATWLDKEALHGPVDDEYAALAADLVLGMVSKRQRRLYWVAESFPLCFIRGLSSEGWAAECMLLLRRHKENHDWLLGTQPHGKAMTKLLERHQFLLTPVQQLLIGAELGGWQWTPEVRELVESYASGVGSSNICENLNNAMKNNNQAKGSMKFRRPQRSMAAAISANITDKRYKFTLPDMAIPLARASVELKPEIFGRQTPPPTAPIGHVASTQAKAAWFSPLAEELHKPAGDLHLLDTARVVENPLMVEHAFLSLFFDYRHHVVIRRKGNRDGDMDWHYVLWHFQDSVGYGWPVTFEDVPRHPGGKVLTFLMHVQTPVPITVTTWTNVTAVRVKWMSPIGQVVLYPNAGWAPAIRGFMLGDEEPLAMLAAKAGFWKIDLTDLKKVAKTLGFSLDDDAVLASALYKVCKHINSKWTDDDVFKQCLPARFVADPEPDPECTSMLLDVDEAASCLLKDEAEKLHGEQKRARDHAIQNVAFHEEYKELVQEKMKLTSAKKSTKTSLKLPENMDTFEQGDVKKLMPPTNAKVWKSRANASWRSQVKFWPKENSRSTRTRGQTRALQLLISETWYQWSVLEGKSYDDCPIDGLLPLQIFMADGP